MCNIHELLHTENNTSTALCFHGRCTLHPQQRCGFRKAQRQSETKRSHPEEADAGGYKDGVRTQPGAPVPLRKPDRLFRPLVFTVGVVLPSYRENKMILIMSVDVYSGYSWLM